MIGSPDLKLMADDAARAYRRAGFEVHTAPFRYELPEVTVARDGAGDDVDVFTRATTDRDSIFAWMATTASFRDDDHPGHEESYFGGWSLQIEDSGSGYRLLGPDRVLPHQALVGYADAPFVLGFPYLFAPSSLVTATLRGSGEIGPVRLMLHGVKLFTHPFTRRVLCPGVPTREAA